MSRVFVYTRFVSIDFHVFLYKKYYKHKRGVWNFSNLYKYLMKLIRKHMLVYKCLLFVIIILNINLQQVIFSCVINFLKKISHYF